MRRVKSAFIPLKRSGNPEEVANIPVLLAFPVGAYLTGSTLTVDGAPLLMRIPGP